MRWFTREWQSGELPDDEWERVVPDYRRHLQEIRPLLAGRADELPDVNLHDGQVLGLTFNEQVLTWSIRIGDLQVGYEIATLTYLGARLVNRSPTELDGMKLTAREVEVLYDELDVAGEDLVHRVLFWPSGELHIAFQAVVVRRRPSSRP